MSSRSGALEDFAERTVQVLVPDSFAFARVEASKGFWARDSSNEYPQLFLNADPPKPITQPEQVNASLAHIEYEQELFARISVNSDGIRIGDARQAALMLADLVVDTLIKQVPDNMPSASAPGCLIPLQAMFVDIDVGLCSILQPFKIKFSSAW